MRKLFSHTHTHTHTHTHLGKGKMFRNEPLRFETCARLLTDNVRTTRPVAEKNGFYLCEREGEGTDRYTDRETEMETQAERQAERRVLDRDS